jgi:hypothetical protein
MKSQTLQTVIWGGLAAVLSALAAYFYPWPQFEKLQGQVNQPLFDEFEDRKVNVIVVEQFNPDLQSLERITLQRRGERYVFPGFDNFNADNVRRIAEVIGSVKKKVLDVISDKVEDHSRFGVVDPQDFQSTTNRGQLGKKVSILDSNRGTLASLIVGLPPDDLSKQNQRYVRIEGQPNIYLVEFDDRVLSPRFADWVDPNLLRLGLLDTPTQVVNDNYRIEPSSLNENPIPIGWLYQATFALSDRNTFPLNSLKFEQNGRLVPVEPNESQLSFLEQGLGSIANFPLVKVRRVDKDLAQILRRADKANPSADYESLEKFGFVPPTEMATPSELLAVGGRIEIMTRGNVRISVLAGNLETTNQTRSKLCRWVLILAQPDLSSVSQPTQPTAEEEAAMSEEQKVELARARRDFEQKENQAKQLAENLDALHAGWLYSVDEDFFTRIRPEISSSAATQSTDDRDAPIDTVEQSTDSDADSKIDDDEKNETDATSDDGDTAQQQADGDGE